MQNVDHGSFYDSEYYNGTRFIVDRLSTGWLYTENCFIVKGRGNTREEARKDAFDRWDKYLLKKK